MDDDVFAIVSAMNMISSVDHRLVLCVTTFDVFLPMFMGFCIVSPRLCPVSFSSFLICVVFVLFRVFA